MTEIVLYIESQIFTSLFIFRKIVDDSIQPICFSCNQQVFDIVHNELSIVKLSYVDFFYISDDHCELNPDVRWQKP